MIDYTHVIAFAIGGTLIWIVLTLLHRKAMDELVDLSKKCLDDVGRHAIYCMEQLRNFLGKNDRH